MAGEERTRELESELLAEASAAPLLSPGTLVAERYEIRERIGSGGVGDVYRAHDRLADAGVALKLLRQQGTGPMLQRVRRELRLLRALSHPGVIRIFDIGVLEGRLFTVSELLAGESLDRRLERSGPLLPAEADRLVRRILAALAVAHGAGIVHRDVKPANVFLAREPDGSERVVLLDFGLARRTSDPALTETGRFLGTPYYVAPEQALGREEAGPPADLYAVGATLWQMLSGKPPFHGGSEVEILRAHLETPPPRPRRALSGAPWRLRALALRLLEKDPSRRPADASRALEWFERLSWGRSLAGRLSRTVRRRRVGMTAALLASGASLVAAGWLAQPVGVRAEGRSLIFETRLGASASTRPLPGPVRLAALDHGSTALAPAAWVALDPASTPDAGVALEGGFPALYRARGWFAPTMTPVWSEPPPEIWSPPPGATEALPLTLRRLVPMAGAGSGFAAFALILEQSPHFPSRFVMVKRPSSGTTGRQPVLGAFDHPGHPNDCVAAPAPSEGIPRLVCTATNNWVGPRPVTFALPATDRLAGQAPPFVFPLAYRRPVSPWYVFHPAAFPARLTEVRVDRDELLVALAPDRVLRLRLRDGVPVEAADRGGLSETEWADRRAELIGLLVDAARHRDAGRAPRGAPALERFADGAQQTPVMASVAYYRAALARLRTDGPGRERALRRALADMDAALRLERQPARYRLLRAELLARAGERRAFTAQLQAEVLQGLGGSYAYEWLMLNAWMGEPVPWDDLVDRWDPSRRGYWTPLIRMAGLARRGAASDVGPVLARLEATGRTWDLHLYWAARALVDSERPDPARALELLEGVVEAIPSGWTVPVALLEARARRSLGEDRLDAGLERRAGEELRALERESAYELHALSLLDLAREDAAVLSVR